jgi:response regulator of citrate/malate metabolism
MLSICHVTGSLLNPMSAHQVGEKIDGYVTTSNMTYNKESMDQRKLESIINSIVTSVVRSTFPVDELSS